TPPKGRELNGATRLGRPRRLATVLAESGAGQPLLVGQDYGTGRTLAFGGDTTHRWVRNDEGRRVHARFWRQVVLWLARREETDATLRLRPAVRRIRAGDRLGFGVARRGKSGEDLKDVRYDVKVVAPKGGEAPAPVAREGSEDRGAVKPRQPGEYR